MNKFFFLLLLQCLIINAVTDADIFKASYLNSVVPKKIELRERVITTIFCEDCSYLPRVEKAGQIFDKDRDIQYQLMHNGIKICKDCYYGEWMTTLIKYCHGHHEPQEEVAFHEVLKYLPKNAVMLELGSYWGYYSMWLKMAIPSATTYLIEPDPQNIEIGKRNFALNKLSGIFEWALIDSKSSEAKSFTDWDYNTFLVRAIALDDYTSENNISFVHVLHSDIQGAEIAMLEGCHRLMSEKRIGYYFISTHRGTHEKCLEILKRYNLNILISITREESFSADGLIVAKLPNMEDSIQLNISRRTPELIRLIKGICNNES